MRRLPRKPASEQSADLAAMRQLANLSARVAIEHHGSRRWSLTAVGKLIVALFALAVGGGLMTWAPVESRLAHYGAVAAFVVAAFWLLQGTLVVRHVWRAKRRLKHAKASAGAMSPHEGQQREATNAGAGADSPTESAGTSDVSDLEQTSEPQQSAGPVDNGTSGHPGGHALGGHAAGSQQESAAENDGQVQRHGASPTEVLSGEQASIPPAAAESAAVGSAATVAADSVESAAAESAVEPAAVSAAGSAESAAGSP
jgi:hypothetical protein